jgi:hypothetical protein
MEKVIDFEEIIEECCNEDKFQEFDKSIHHIASDANSNKQADYTNPILDNGVSLNDQVVEYKKYDDMLSEDYSEEEKEAIVFLRDDCFKYIISYYKRFEMRWWHKIGDYFDDFNDFWDFYYEITLYCIGKYDPDREFSKNHDNDFRKSKKSQTNFNAMWYGFMNHRKNNRIKLLCNTKKNPSVVCQICGDDVTSISDYHLSHRYTVAMVKREFKVDTVDGEGGKMYEECPICHEKDVPSKHVASHSYAENISVEEYIERFPGSKTNNSIVSLDMSIRNNDEGEGATVLDLYDASNSKDNGDLNYKFFMEHVDHVLKNRSFMSKVIKCKMESNCTVKDIAMRLGEVFYFAVDASESGHIVNKTGLCEYLDRKNIDIDYLNRNRSSFHIVDFKETGNSKVFILSTVSKARVSSELSKLRSNKDGVLDNVLGRKVDKSLIAS